MDGNSVTDAGRPDQLTPAEIWLAAPGFVPFMSTQVTSTRKHAWLPK
jgi:hypothetical protein